jgi:pimeloyl-ACP methyl ester carboxylesterase
MLTYEIHGSGKPVVLLHAFPLSRKMWEPQIAVLSKNSELIIPDLPGFGDSKRQLNPSIAGAAVELAELLEHLHVEQPVFLAGLSMGGYVALEFLRQFPSRKVSGLALLSSRVTADSPEAREKRMLGIQTLKEHGLKPYARKLVTTLTGKTAQENNKPLIERVLNLMLSNPAESVIDALQALADRRNNTAVLSSLKVPLLIMAGEEDAPAFTDEAKAMHEQVPSSEFHLIKKSGHLINLEQAEEFNEIFGKFVRAHA